MFSKSKEWFWKGGKLLLWDFASNTHSNCFPLKQIHREASEAGGPGLLEMLPVGQEFPRVWIPTAFCNSPHSQLPVGMRGSEERDEGAQATNTQKHHTQFQLIQLSSKSNVGPNCPLSFKLML